MFNGILAGVGKELPPLLPAPPQPSVGKKLLFCGPGRAGKDTALDYLERITTLRNAGTFSRYLAPYVAQKLGLPEDVAYARRHESDEMRMKWFVLGNELREKDPAALLRAALANGELTGGARNKNEVIAAKAERLVDLVVWIANDRCVIDPTMEFDSRSCDVVIENHWSLVEFEDRLKRFARFAGLPLRGVS
jgi:hypothetical protein